MAVERSDAALARRQSSGAEESARLSALRGYCVLDTGREARFDDLTCLAASICETPVSLASLVDANRLFFKSAHGMDVREVPYPDFSAATPFASGTCSSFPMPPGILASRVTPSWSVRPAYASTPGLR